MADANELIEYSKGARFHQLELTRSKRLASLSQQTSSEFGSIFKYVDIGVQND